MKSSNMLHIDMAIDQLAIGTGSCDDGWHLATLYESPLGARSYSSLSPTSLQTHSPDSLTSKSQDFQLISAELTPGKSLAYVFAAFGLDLEAEKIRLRLSSSRSLQELFDNHNAGSLILENLGLAGFRMDPNAKQIYRYTGGLELDATAVISQGFAWSVVTYSKKSRAFIWAENLHNFRWKNSELKGMFSTHNTVITYFYFLFR
jgi:hypothetical protein